MPELLLELGCEELPATFVAKASTDLENAISSRLQEVFGQKFKAKLFATPRRLIVAFFDIPLQQEDSIKEMRGPSIGASFDANDVPQGPLIGFCKANGVAVETVERRDGYIWMKKSVVGLASNELLSQVLPDAIKSLTFEKSMRWGSGKLRFARPIRWILAAFNGQLINFEIEGVTAGLESRGHRFYFPKPFSARDLEELLTGLRTRKVEPDPAIRRGSIVEQSKSVAPGIPDLPADLVEENVYLTEFPTAISGTFGEHYLELPSSVLVTAMAKHEKMFPVKSRSDGKLTNGFVFIRNGGEDETVRLGTEWVLNARLDDARFFYQEDQKYSLAEFLEKCDQIVFQANLGTIRDRAERLHDLTSFVASKTDADEDEVDHAARAGLYAKADLSTGLVSELAS
ncbi:MAG: glycine--tRNA ligase subunit beta, partial [Rhabdochlamydiaceae bacterium]